MDNKDIYWYNMLRRDTYEYENFSRNIFGEKTP